MRYRITNNIHRCRKCGASADHIGYGMAYCAVCYRRIYGEVRD
ncbi:hypothetical protein [uncultured Ruminococcus sp.]|nr:hypothetical protein [uncultured Ruminococcus sp.]